MQFSLTQRCLGQLKNCPGQRWVENFKNTGCIDCGQSGKKLSFSPISNILELLLSYGFKNSVFKDIFYKNHYLLGQIWDYIKLFRENKQGGYSQKISLSFTFPAPNYYLCGWKTFPLSHALKGQCHEMF